MKTTKQLFEMYRDLMRRKRSNVAHEDVQQFVDYCYDVHDLVVNGGAFSNDGKRQFLYIN